ncbi:hypothetical protein [Streptomyces hilarionis]|uniref:hypothetical protein n=1 Tax=Streptomyces hilarionis TaxID=2839954 RepID=UPI002119E539|nr:hypothetical protein [Streptomyces hilarionis]MCQ9129901.1 hypothetical protein [Streptomyces hilarionis]
MICRSRARRRAGGAVFLLLAVAGCSNGGSALGTVEYTTPAGQVVKIQSPPDDGCHRLPGGARSVRNYTVDDLRLYADANCVLTKAGDDQSGRTGGESFYLGTQMSVPFTPGQTPWRSYSVVGGGA